MLALPTLTDTALADDRVIGPVHDFGGLRPGPLGRVGGVGVVVRQDLAGGTLRDSEYKLKVRMQETDAVGKYSDVNLYHETYKKKDVCRIMTDGEITSVLGQLKKGPV